MSFADADEEYEDADVVIIGVPFDKTVSFRDGTREAPNYIREASYNFETYYPEYDSETTEISLCDLGDLDVSSVEDTAIEVKKSTTRILYDDKLPVIIGGEHSITIYSSAAFKEKFKDDSFFVVIDAHLDMRDLYNNNKFSHACVSRRVFEKFGNDIALIGQRSGSKEEYKFIKKNNISLYSSDDVNNGDLKEIISDIKDKASGKKIYLSLDMDAVDCMLAPGVGNPEPYGLNPYQVREIVSRFSKDACLFDIVEVSPKYDSNGETAMLAAKIIRDFIMEKYFG
ncbi:MAG TPA: agmatinase [Halobacteria archaeon]|nr:agmatinase [Halobacteria archaeon]